MNDATQDEPFLGTSTLRGILLLGGVVAVAYVSFKLWKKQKAVEASLPQKQNLIRIPIAAPVLAQRTPRK